jgi:predicted nucleic acid-binding protein
MARRHAPGRNATCSSVARLANKTFGEGQDYCGLAQSEDLKPTKVRQEIAIHGRARSNTEDSDDPEHRASLQLLRTGDLATLDLALYETTNVALVQWRDPDAAARLSKRVWAMAEFGTLVRIDRQLGDEVAKLASERSLSAYDAGYVAAARKLGVELASCDERDLVRTGLARLPSSLAGG